MKPLDEFTAFAAAELKEWTRLSCEQRSLIIAFCVCIKERIEGRDPSLLLPGRRTQ